MNLYAELKAPTQTTLFQQNSLANRHDMTFFPRHSAAAGLNMLVDYSATVFRYIQLLTQNASCNETKKNLMEYLQILRQDYQQLGYSEDTLIAAHYIICATFDDVLRCLGTETQCLQNFHDSSLEQEKFYIILQHISPQAEKYIDLLELMYLCLRFGYKGQYRNTPFGLQQWTLLTDNIYQLITQIRGQHSHTLSPNLLFVAHSASAPLANVTTIAKKHPRHFYLLTLLILIFVSIITGFIFRQTYNTTRETLSAHPIAAFHSSQQVTT